MQTKTYTIYEYDELTDKAKEKAREWYRNVNDYPLLPDCMRETAEELLTAAGFKELDIKDVYYSLFHCQGDGAMVEFTGTYTDDTGTYRLTVKHSGRYSHERSTIIDCINTDTGEEDYDKGEEIEENVIVPAFKALAKAGYAYIDAEDEDENVAETIRANGYTFDINGNRES